MSSSAREGISVSGRESPSLTAKATTRRTTVMRRMSASEELTSGTVSTGFGGHRGVA